MHHLSPPIWEPAEKAIPDLLPDIMYMSTVDYQPRFGRARKLHQYKHIGTRRYINLDDDGRAWRITRQYPDSYDARQAQPVALPVAVEYLTAGTDWSQFRS